ncbi:TPR-like protein [Dichomitus squalens]|uniref:TPR-like protein n=1 Tax=Dichomitus squalens TaxID=114155 RepID=A0A4Q9Q6Z2_9APHY|nr:TPR-like protein [Dichomitus squalens]TBU62731.1 TPR-like protein [Dichomitus squalens]
MAEITEQPEEQQQQTTTGEQTAAPSNLSAGGDIGEKFNVAKEKKAAGDEAFKSNDLVGALRYYHQALLYLKGLDKNATQKALGQPVPPPPPIEAVNQAAEEKQRTEVEFLSEKIYSNMSQVHLKRGNWRRAIETADEALRHNKKSYKALFRKARALKEQGYFEKAEKILEELIKDGDPNDREACEEELASVRAKDKAVTVKHDQKMKGFLNKEKIDLSKD